ncbi:MAG: carbohydrate ABC transporter permease [Reyranellales bacterium]
MTAPSLAPAPPGSLRGHRRPAFSLGRWVEPPNVFSWLMVTPPVLFLAALVGYPLFYGIWLSLMDRPVASEGTFIGLANYAQAWHDPVFWQVVINTFVYTAVATLLKMFGGLGLALVMNQDFRFKNLTRALLLLPFIVPTVLSTIAWQWILDPAFSIINWTLIATGLITPPGPSWLGNPHLAMGSLIVVNVWRGLPFYAITLLAGLQTISPELYEAATIDGASTWGRFRWVTLPLMKPVIFIVTMFSVIFTFSDFQLIYVLTHGGPASATQVFATYAFDIAMNGGQLGQGAAIALTMVPPLALLILAMAIYLKPDRTT